MNNGIDMGVVEFAPDNEQTQIVFENKAELEQFIADYIVDFLTEGDGDGK